MKGFISGCAITALVVVIVLADRGTVKINQKDVEESANTCKFRGGLSAAGVYLGEQQVYYYCDDGYQALPAPGSNYDQIRHEFESHVVAESLDLHLGFADGKYSNRSTRAAFELFRAGAEVE